MKASRAVSGFAAEVLDRIDRYAGQLSFVKPAGMTEPDAVAPACR